MGSYLSPLPAMAARSPSSVPRYVLRPAYGAFWLFPDEWLPGVKARKVRGPINEGRADQVRNGAANTEERTLLWTVPPKQSPELTIAGRRCGTGLWRPSRLIRRADARLVGSTGLRCPARPIRPADAGLIGCPRLICCTGLRYPAGLIGCAGLRHRAGLIGCAGLRCPTRLIGCAGLRCPTRLIGGAGLGRPSRLIGPLSMQRVGPMQNKT